MTPPTDQSKRLVRLCAWLAAAAVLGLAAAGEVFLAGLGVDGGHG